MKIFMMGVGVEEQFPSMFRAPGSILSPTKRKEEGEGREEGRKEGKYS
jgi:hypothetical protein